MYDMLAQGGAVLMRGVIVEKTDGVRNSYWNCSARIDEHGNLYIEHVVGLLVGFDTALKYEPGQWKSVHSLSVNDTEG